MSWLARYRIECGACGRVVPASRDQAAAQGSRTAHEGYVVLEHQCSCGRRELVAHMAAPITREAA
jgi:hypothetical protein